MTIHKKKYCLNGLAACVAVAACSFAFAEPTGQGVNLSIGAGSDGSSKASGSSYGNVRDGDVSSYWAPSGSTGRISIKWSSETTIGGVIIREASGFEGAIGAWEIVDNDSGAVLSSGSGAGGISFDSVSLKKVNFEILSSNGTPTVAEFETYASVTDSDDSGDDSGDDSSDDNDSGSSDDATLTIQENSSGFCDVEGTIDSNNTGYTGSGFANSDNENGRGVEWSIDGDTGTYTLSFRYANGSTTDRSATIYVDDTAVGNLSFAATGAWTTWAMASIPVDLSNGQKTIRLAASQDSGLANIDYLEVTGPNITAADCANNDGSDDGGTDDGDTDDDGDVVVVGGDCDVLINDNDVNWRESDLQSDQEIVACLAASLGKPVGFGEDSTGGYDVNGNSKLIVITNDNPEDQLLEAISSADYKWIVFDKDDFRNETQLMMYRPYCSDSGLQSALGLSDSECRDPYTWCSQNGVSDSSCLATFFNDTLNDSDLPIRNYMIDSNTTIDGRGANATFVFNGFKIGADSSGASTHQSDNVIITNNKFIGVGHVEDHNLDPDMIRSTGESHDIWIHQNTFENTGDSAFDIKVGAYDITVSFNRLLNVKRAALHGSSDSRTINSQITTTIHNNMFVTEDHYYSDSRFETLRRVPLMRRGQSHMFNNVFYNYRKDILSVRVGGRILFENNIVLNNATEAEAIDDDLSYFVEQLLRDFREGGLEVLGSHVWMANSNCELQGSAGDLTKSEGSTPDMLSQYNSTSRSTIGNYLITAGQDLTDYVSATAGKGGETPWLVSGAPSISQVVANAPTSCQ